MPVGLLATLIVAIANTGLAQEKDKASFAGTWVLVSSQHAPQRLRVTQDESRLTVTEWAGTRESAFVYLLDGSESRNETRSVTGENWTHVSRARWVSSALTITTTTTRESIGGRGWDSMTTYSRDGAGNLRVTRTEPVTDPGPFVSMAESTAIYAKR